MEQSLLIRTLNVIFKATGDRCNTQNSLQQFSLRLVYSQIQIQCFKYSVLFLTNWDSLFTSFSRSFADSCAEKRNSCRFVAVDIFIRCYLPSSCSSHRFVGSTSAEIIKIFFENWICRIKQYVD